MSEDSEVIISAAPGCVKFCEEGDKLIGIPLKIVGDYVVMRLI